jgi:predicted DNA binding CopG/RHH family protein
MNRPMIPQTDSIEELARFWDTHDLTDFEDELEEVTAPVFERSAVVKVPLQPQEIEAVKEIAKNKGIGSAELIREWILEKLPRS